MILIRLRVRAGWSAHLFLASNKVRVSLVEVHIMLKPRLSGLRMATSDGSFMYLYYSILGWEIKIIICLNFYLKAFSIHCFIIRASAWDFQQCGTLMWDQQRLRTACAYAQPDKSLCLSLEYSMNVKLLTEHHLKFLKLKRGCRGSAESTHVKMPHCWKSHSMAQNFLFS